MKRILLTLILLSPLAFAEEIKLTPLSEYIKIADPNDEVTWEFISKRCAAISLTLTTRWFPEGSEQYQTNKENYGVYALAAMEMRKKKYPNADVQKITTSITNDILRLIDPIDSIMIESQDKTGSFLENWLMSDIVICEGLFK